MKNKKSMCQRPLFTDWPTRHELPTEVQQQVETLVANMYLAIVNPTHEVHDQEQSNEPTD